MRLYYSPAACSLAPHIVAHEAGIDLALARVDLGSHKTADGRDFHEVSPNGYVPALKLDSGEVFTEAALIIQYLADLKPSSGLLPTAGTIERYRALEWLNFIATELHKGLGPLWDPTTPDAVRRRTLHRLAKRFSHIEQRLAGRDYIAGAKFTAPDAYAFTILNWAGPLKFDLAPWPGLQAYVARVAARPGVRAALQAEGLLKEEAAA